MSDKWGNHTHTLPHHFALPGTAAGGEVAPPTQAELIKYLGTLSSYIAELDLPSNSLSNKTSEHPSHHSCPAPHHSSDSTFTYSCTTVLNHHTTILHHHACTTLISDVTLLNTDNNTALKQDQRACITHHSCTSTSSCITHRSCTTSFTPAPHHHASHITPAPHFHASHMTPARQHLHHVSDVTLEMTPTAAEAPCSYGRAQAAVAVPCGH